MSRIRAFSAAVLLVLVGCNDFGPLGKSRSDAYLGAWRSTTAPYEDARLTVNNTPTVVPGLNIRLTISGNDWEGPARLESDSLFMYMSTLIKPGLGIVARPGSGGALSVHLVSPAFAAPLSLTFVRDD